MEPWQDVKWNYQEKLIISIVLFHQSVSFRNQVQNTYIVIRVNMSDENYSQIEKDLVNKLWTVMIRKLIIRSLTTVEHH